MSAGPDSGGVTPLEAVAREIARWETGLPWEDAWFSDSDRQGYLTAARAVLTAAIEALPTKEGATLYVGYWDGTDIVLKDLRRALLGET